MKRSPRDFWPAVLGLAVLSAVALYVQAPYRDLPMVQDDVFILLVVGLKRIGRISWLDFVFPPYNQHWVPLWKFLFYWENKVFGIEPLGWRSVAAFVQAASGAAAYAWLRVYGVGRLGAGLAAVMWAGAAIGRWDNPLAFLSGVAIPVALVCLQGALLCASGYGRSRSDGLAIVMSGLICVSILLFGPMLILAPIVVLQILLLEVRRDDSRRRRWIWGLAWGVPVVLFAIIQSAAVDTSTHPLPDFAGGRRWIEVVERTVGQCAVQWGNMLIWKADGSSIDGLATKWVLLIVFLAAVGLFVRRNWRLTLIAASFAISYQMLVNVARLDVPLEAALSWGRYAYYPVFSLCLLSGLLVDAIVHSRPGTVAKVGVGSIAFLSIWHQRQIAETTAKQFHALLQPNIDALKQNEKLLRFIADRAAESGGDVKFPDLPVTVPPVDEVYFPLSAWSAVVSPFGSASLSFKPMMDCSRGELECSDRLLRKSSSPLAAIWKTRVDDSLKLGESVSWLNEFAQREGNPLAVPDLMIQSAGARYRLAQFVRLAFSKPMEYLDWRPEGSFSAPEIAKIVERLSRETGPSASFWKQFFSAARPEPPTARPRLEP